MNEKMDKNLTNNINSIKEGIKVPRNKFLDFLQEVPS